MIEGYKKRLSILLNSAALLLGRLGGLKDLSRSVLVKGPEIFEQKGALFLEEVDLLGLSVLALGLQKSDLELQELLNSRRTEHDLVVYLFGPLEDDHENLENTGLHDQLIELLAQIVALLLGHLDECL